MKLEISDILESRGVIAPSEHPRLARTIEHYAATGRLQRVLGGHYAPSSLAGTIETRLAALRGACPNAVLVRETAARMSWWPEIRVDVVQAAAADWTRRRKGFSFERRAIPPDLLTWDGEHFLTAPALTVLDLTDTLGGTAIDEALRRGAVTLQDVRDALVLTKGRRGNRERERLLKESRAEPWSKLERDAHVELRKAHFPGWVANHEVVIDGRRYYVDLAVPELLLAAEIDGWQYHRTFENFVSDRQKWNDLTLAGWTVLHFTASTMGELVGQMTAARQMLLAR